MHVLCHHLPGYGHSDHQTRDDRWGVAHGCDSHEGQRSNRRIGYHRRLPTLFRLSHHPAERAACLHGAANAEGGRHLPAGGERSGGDQHGVRRRRRRRTGHDLLVLARREPQDGRNILPRGRRAPRRRGEHDARRTRAGQHRGGSGRLLPGREGRRARRLSQHRARAEHGAGARRPDRKGIRSRR